jgi:predicted nucleotidyltransferase component of viral defense system
VIPYDYITRWRDRAPWIQDEQVEQDLILSRALVEMFRDANVARLLAFRGGTSLYKLHLPPARYSEDIDLVQIDPGPIGPTFDAIRAALDPWLGTPRRAQKEGRMTLVYRTQSERSQLPLRIKIEINSREHFQVFGLRSVPFAVESQWFSGNASIQTYGLDELLGTKLRALYQRKKGRDLFDLWTARERASVDARRVVDCFQHYLRHEGAAVSRAEFEANLADKLKDDRFLSDIAPLLPPRSLWDLADAARYVQGELLVHLPGEPWKGQR